MEANLDNITWITSISQHRFEGLVYKKCLESWYNIPGKKVIFAEGNIPLNGFEIIDLESVIDYDYFKTIKGLTYTRIYKKAISIHWSLKNIDSDYIVWLDADTMVHKPLDVFPTINESWASMFFDAKDGKLLDRYPQGIETGFVYFNKKMLPDNFADDYINWWHNKTIESLHRPKDTYVLLEMALNDCAYGNIAIDHSDLPPGKNAFSRTIFKDYFTHYIGAGNKR